jgi:hypothetical protein
MSTKKSKSFVGTWIEPVLKTSLQAIAKSEKRSFGQVLRFALEEFVERRKAASA